MGFYGNILYNAYGIPEQGIETKHLKNSAVTAEKLDRIYEQSSYIIEETITNYQDLWAKALGVSTAAPYWEWKTTASMPADNVTVIKTTSIVGSSETEPYDVYQYAGNRITRFMNVNIENGPQGAYIVWFIKIGTRSPRMILMSCKNLSISILYGAVNKSLQSYINTHDNTNWNYSLLQIQNESIATDAVTKSKIAAQAVGTSELKDGEVTTVKLANNAITNNKISDGAITTSKIANNQIETKHFKDKKQLVYPQIDTAVTSLAQLIAIIQSAVNQIVTFKSIGITNQLIQNSSETNITGTGMAWSKYSDQIYLIIFDGTMSLKRYYIQTTTSGNEIYLIKNISDNEITDAMIGTYELDPQKLDPDKLGKDQFPTEQAWRYWDILFHNNQPNMGSKGITTISLTDFAAGLRTDLIKDNSISTDKLQGQAVDTSKIADNAITNDKIADNAITKDKISGNPGWVTATSKTIPTTSTAGEVGDVLIHRNATDYSDSQIYMCVGAMNDTDNNNSKLYYWKEITLK